MKYIDPTILCLSSNVTTLAHHFGAHKLPLPMLLLGRELGVHPSKETSVKRVRGCAEHRRARHDAMLLRVLREGDITLLV